jgi:hypothetical protein
MTKNLENFKETFNKTDAVTLREYFCTKLSALEDRIELNLKLNQIALDKSENAINVRLEGLNEWRVQNKDERSKFITNEVYEAKHSLIESKIEALQKLVFIGLGIVIAVEFVLNFIN